MCLLKRTYIYIVLKICVYIYIYFKGSVIFLYNGSRVEIEKWRYYSGTPEVRACPLFSRRFLNGGTIVVL